MLSHSPSLPSSLSAMPAVDAAVEGHLVLAAVPGVPHLLAAPHAASENPLKSLATDSQPESSAMGSCVAGVPPPQHSLFYRKWKLSCASPGTLLGLSWDSPLTFRTYQILPHTHRNFHGLYSYLVPPPDPRVDLASSNLRLESG